MSQFKYSWDNMIRNLRSNILTQEPKTVEHIFSRAPTRCVRICSTTRGCEMYTFLSEMVNKAIREERHRRNQEELMISASGGSKARSAMP